MTILSVLAQTNNPSWSLLMLCPWITCSHVETRSTLKHYHDYRSTIMYCSYSLLVIGETIDTNYKVFYFILTTECPTRTEHTSSWIIEAVRFLIVRKKNNNVRFILIKIYISLLNNTIVIKRRCYEIVKKAIYSHLPDTLTYSQVVGTWMTAICN